MNGREERRTPLLEAHQELGAKLTEFGGWRMPLQYGGVIAEHNAVRNSVGIFDVSHLGKLRVVGDEGGEALQRAVTADVQALEVGAARYALVLTHKGGTIDDVFVYRIGDQEWLVVPNAANNDAVFQAISSAGHDPIDEWADWAILAIQGPDSFDLFDRVFPGSGARGLKLHRWKTVDVMGEDGIVARTGYTGERGFELYAPANSAPQAFKALLDAGGAPVGLGARDTLRLEMGFALYGHELTTEINPLEAGLGWAVAWDAPFRGKDALEAVRSEGPERKLFGVVCSDKGVPRQDHAVAHEGREIGRLTSGNFSPTLGAGIGLALGPTSATPSAGAEVVVTARNRSIAAAIVKPPFIKKGSGG
ncbi:MAG: glycine cleavage system aminomethyltransferase GcvT [Actinomycetota bacterium]